MAVKQWSNPARLPCFTTTVIPAKVANFRMGISALECNCVALLLDPNHFSLGSDTCISVVKVSKPRTQSPVTAPIGISC